eukprot:jgi/Mesen1/8607/ME000050S08020
MEDEEDEVLHCLGKRCFVSPYDGYIPPPIYAFKAGEKVAGKDYRWRVGLLVSERHREEQAEAEEEAEAEAGIGARLKVQRGWALPHCLGIGDDARWRWQWPPVSILAGLKLDMRASADGSLGGMHAKLVPALRFKLLSPVLAPLALRASLEVLPVPVLKVTREMRVGPSSRITLRASLQARVEVKPRGSDVHTAASAPRLHVRYSRSVHLSRDCDAVVAARVEVPLRQPPPPGSPPSPSLEGKGSKWMPAGGGGGVKLKLSSVRVTQLIATRGRREPPKSTWQYLRAAESRRERDTVGVVAGHWIDAGVEPGAPGERDFNLEVADSVERRLRGAGWSVLRPDRDAPHARWEDYLNWVSRQTMRGVPVLEIHGQGSKADYRGLVLGVIGEQAAPLSKELAKHFGMFPMDWRELAVPRRGGVIVESFNSDEVLQMAPWHRKWAVAKLASQMASCVNRAASLTRPSSPP